MGLVPKIIFVLEEGGHASQLPSFGGGPVDPGYGVPSFPGRPDQSLPGSGGSPDQSLPPIPHPPIFVPPDGRPSHPIAPSFPPRPSHPIARPGRPVDPGYGVDEGGAEAGQLPSTKPARNGHILIWFPSHGYVWFEIPSARPDHELPETPEPK